MFVDQVQQRGLYKWPLLPPGVRNAQSVMVQCLIAIEYDVEVQGPGAIALTSKVTTKGTLQAVELSNQ